MLLIRAVGVSAWLSGLCMLSGCWLPFGVIDVTKPDPRRKEAVRVTEVFGRMVTLADGRRVELAGVEIPSQGLDPYHARVMQASMTSTLIHSNVIVVPEANGRGRVIEIRLDDQPRYEGFVCLLVGLIAPRDGYYPHDVPIGILIPIFVFHEAHRRDLGEYFVWAGLAKALPEEIADEKVRAAYQAAAESARKEKRGMWMGLNERLLDAIQRADPHAVPHLLEAGADPNARDSLGDTALHWAVRYRYAGTVKMLISRGADVNAPGNGGRTPLEEASYGQRYEIAEILRAHGAHK